MMYDSNEEIEPSSGSEWITNYLCLGDNVAIPTTIDEPFRLKLVDKGAHFVSISFKDIDGNEWMEGEMVV
jgi:hypothetical protein